MCIFVFSFCSLYLLFRSVKMSSFVSSSVSETSTKKRMIIPEHSREIIFNVYNYFKETKTSGNLLDIVAQATKISRGSIARIVREGRAIETGEKTAFLTAPIPKCSPKSSTDNFAEEAIRRVIFNFHITDNQKPTIKMVYNKIKDDEGIGFTGKVSSFRTLLHKIGFRWRKTTDNRKILMERNDIRELRCCYIRAVTSYRAEGRPIIYTDETYLHASHTMPYEWTHESNQGLKCPISKGKRLIIVHAGGNKGFIDNALLIFKSGQKTGDYHDDMNLINYKKWLTEALIPNLPPRSVIVLDNASYHNALALKHPNSNTNKNDMKQWLDERNIIYGSNYTKTELYKLIKQNKPAYKAYTIDSLLVEKGHSVLRLPPYHPELNPIEKIWGIVKNRVAKKNVTFKLDDVEQLAMQEFASITKDDWQSVCQHVINIENKFIADEHIMDDYSELIINLEDSDDDDDYQLSSDDDL